MNWHGHHFCHCSSFAALAESVPVESESSETGTERASGSSQGSTLLQNPAISENPPAAEGCKRTEPGGGTRGATHPSRSHQDSDDSDDDPILIPSARYKGAQGQRYGLLVLRTLVKYNFCRAAALK